MFKRDVQQINNLILRCLRQQGLETPLLQKRLVEAWPVVAGEAIGRYTMNAYIVNQTLFVRLSSPALRADLSMRRQEFVQKMNDYVGSVVIADIRFC
jgi:predicted nucleic acid-binding Zn ribbon protein